MKQTKDTAGLYIHIPFCRRKCDYCDFFSQPITYFSDFPKTQEKYIDRVIEEIKERYIQISDHTFDTIYLGGGTPSLLSPNQVKYLLDTIKNSLTFHDRVEITMEVNPEDIQKILPYREAGINRVNLGVQTLIPDLHEILGRSTKTITIDAIEEFFKVEDILHCIDFICGIPSSEKIIPRDDYNIIKEFRPEHISIYSLTIEQTTPLAERIKCNNCLEAFQRNQLEEVIFLMHSLGYHHYEISNFALPGFESRHNSKYWNFDPYIGLGPGAHSFYDNKRFFNTMNIKDYLVLPLNITEDIRSKNDIIIEYVLTNMRLLNGMSEESLKKKLGVNFPENLIFQGQKLAREGLIAYDANNCIMKLTSKGIFFADKVIYRLVEELL